MEDTPTVFCVEITEPIAIHTFYGQSGFSGKEYRFFKNPNTNSYIRAYGKIQEYIAERNDMHTFGGMWALKFNILPESMIDNACFEDRKPKIKPLETKLPANFDLDALRKMHHSTLKRMAREQGIDDTQPLELIISALDPCLQPTNS